MDHRFSTHLSCKLRTPLKNKTPSSLNDNKQTITNYSTKDTQYNVHTYVHWMFLLWKASAVRYESRESKFCEAAKTHIQRERKSYEVN